ncbi:MAG: DNA/RNA nuclease SfsA [Fibrobacter sp.]|nr:DNA/RNA nuclease SfsA [Fibrobacter sp.]
MISLGKLLESRFLRRRKRFLADVVLNGKEITAHLANTGSMKSLLEENAKAYLSRSENAARKYPYSLEILRLHSGALACVNTSLTNKIVEEALCRGLIREIPAGSEVIPEVSPFPGTRLDFKIRTPAREICWIEVKNVTLLEAGNTAAFPDAVSERGQKHLNTLAALSEKGERTFMFYLVNRTDAETFSIAESIDPAYAEAFREAVSKGVKPLVYASRIFEEQGEWGIEVSKRLPWK